MDGRQEVTAGRGRERAGGVCRTARPAGCTECGGAPHGVRGGQSVGAGDVL